jgi:hypothetical protein
MLGIWKSLSTILIVLISFLILIYFFSILTFAFYGSSSDNVNSMNQNACNATICIDYLKDPYQSFFTMFQFVSGDSWTGDIVTPLESIYNFRSYPYFVPLFCFFMYVITQIVTGYI